jgi:hypothetical protein
MGDFHREEGGNMQGAGKFLIVLGGVIAAVGLIMMFADRIPFLGKLPGDLSFRRGNFEFHFPLATSLLLSVAVTLVLWLISYFRNR